MAINLELPRKMHAVIDKAHQGAAEMMRPIARKYDLKEHAYPVELDTLAELFAGAAESNTLDMAGAGGLKASESAEENRNGANMAAALQALEASWGDAAMLL
ncbi:MAG: acyl-CoA dehydrogenase, partial [Mycobacterium sp.]|nr:acyl-CoA dehydrogenase [Mycobacterium sp.]